jgi:hypothetical protein
MISEVSPEIVVLDPEVHMTCTGVPAVLRLTDDTSHLLNTVRWAAEQLEKSD